MTDEYQAADLRNEIALEAMDSEAFEIEAFARVFARRLEEAEQIFDVNVVPLRFSGPRGRRVEILGYAEDTTEKSLTLFAGRYFSDDSTLTLTDARDTMLRATQFLEFSVSGWASENLEVSSSEAQYASYFSENLNASRYARLRVILITDGVMSDRIRAIESNQIAGLRTSYEIWDQRRLLAAAVPARSSEDIDVDMTKWLESGLPCLAAHPTDTSTNTYLAVLPGAMLAEIFDEYGSLLLESNVRTFLSARGAVNRGIQATLAQEPSRFLAYNNGLTTTATSVTTTQSGAGLRILRIRGLQIVNGGQTTASLVHYLRGRSRVDIEDVFVQMKLVTVDDARRGDVVQSVAKYANSQNRVSGADLFSTHEFHVRMEQISRRLKAPARESEQYQSGWFYERARGQWENDRLTAGSAGEQKKFELLYPKSQRLTKTDWAKYAFCWGKKPHLVSRGAQSVFAEYAHNVDELWQRNSNEFNDEYFRTNIGKAIMYEAVRRAVLKERWYVTSPGYLANIVSYGIAYFAHVATSTFTGMKYDWTQVWQRQGVSSPSLVALVTCAAAAQQHLTDPRRPQANVTQWAKQEAAWDTFRLAKVTLDRESILHDFVDNETDREQASDARRQRAQDTSFENTARVLKVAQPVWNQVYAARASAGLSPLEIQLVELFGVYSSGRVPSDRQSAVLIRALDRMVTSGVIPRNVH